MMEMALNKKSAGTKEASWPRSIPGSLSVCRRHFWVGYRPSWYETLMLSLSDGSERPAGVVHFSNLTFFSWKSAAAFTLTKTGLLFRNSN